MSPEPEILDECPGCHRRGIRHQSGGFCGMCRSRQTRANLTPEQVEKYRETNKKYQKARRKSGKAPIPRETQFLPTVDVFCWHCGEQMVNPDQTGLCGFCKVEMTVAERLMAYNLPTTEDTWKNYFSLLTHAELGELISEANLERMRRTAEAIKPLVERNTKLYGADVPAHHRPGFDSQQRGKNAPGNQEK